jgi:hypothetical protein
MGSKKTDLVLGFLGILFFDGLLLCTAYNVHHYSFIVSVHYDVCNSRHIRILAQLNAVYENRVFFITILWTSSLCLIT